MKKELFSKEGILNIWEKLKKAISYKYFIVGFLLSIVGTLSFIFSKTIYHSFLGEIIVFLKTNPWRSFLGIMLVVSLGVFVFHWKFVGKKTWAWKKAAFIVLWVASLFVYLDKTGFDLTPSQELAIRNEEQRKFDIVLDSIKMDDKLLSKISEKKAEGFKKDKIILKQRLDSLLSVSNAKDEKISSLVGVNKDLKVHNHYLDSLNSLPREPIVIIRDTVIALTSTTKAVLPDAKTDEKKSASNTGKKGYKKPSRQNIVWEAPKRRVKYRPPKICFN